MDNKLIEILTNFAVTKGKAKIAPDFWKHNKANDGDQNEVSRLVSMILIGYVMADKETQEIIEVVGESHIELEADRLFKAVSEAFSVRREKSAAYGSDESTNDYDEVPEED